MRILVALDFADSTGRLLEVAMQQAKPCGATVYLVHVAEPDPSFVGYEAGPDVVRDQVAQEFREQHRMLQTHADALRASGLDATALLVQGPTAKTILAEAERLQIDMIVMGTHGRTAVMDILVGSVSHAVLRNTALPILLVPVKRAP
ncbi:MAG TPA: universal stress protein [Terriglobales bacterium]|nr:universal stress protein [Terriglobales bacterium]